MDKVTLVLILFLLGIVLVTALPHIARVNPRPDRVYDKERDPEFQAEKKPPKVIPVIVPVYPKGSPPPPGPRVIRISPPPKQNRVQNITTVYMRGLALPMPVNVPNSADVGLSQKSV